MVIETGKYTGRDPRDKFIVLDELTEKTVDWNEFNNSIDSSYYHLIHKKMMAHLGAVPKLWISDAYACADERFRVNIRIVTTKPWISFFAHNMFLRPEEKELSSFEPEWLLYKTI